MWKTILTVIILFGVSDIFCQSTNTDPTQGYINVPLPKTPESAGFEKYGNNQVNELTGAVNISIPIYSIKSRFLEAPISLSYSPTGIKVNQEATWVGLGWDLIAGGRITIEAKGTLDIDASTAGLYSRTQLANGLTKLFSRLGNSNSVGIMTYASICRQSGCDTTVPDDAQSVLAMAEFGAGEPDIFRANFMGHSLTFYFDKITGALNWIGEKSLFSVTPTITNGSIVSFTIRDNMGNTYYFNQPETTTITLPSSAIQAPTTTSAWLLTKVLHPTGDYILFNYTNYGSSYPAFSWSSTMSLQLQAGMTGGGSPNQSNDVPQNQTIQNPYYLTSIQTANTEVDFILGSRTDIYGAGSQRLNQIKVVDRLTSLVKKTVTFSYSYFTASTSACFSSLSQYVNLPSGQITPFLACYNQRLRLDSVALNDQTLQTPYRFYYNPLTIDKYSLSQDHWGYYNSATNSANGCAPKYLIPNTGLGTSLGNTAMNGYAVSRECNPSVMAAMMLDSIVYPTGGSSSYFFEPHQTSTSSGSLFGTTGGGLRIKTINNYSMGLLAGSVSYSYSPGVYNGVIEYYTQFTKMQPCPSTGTQYDYTQYTLSTNGTYNDNDVLVAYPVVTVTQTDGAGQTNGTLVKTFNVPTPSRSNNGPGFQLLAAHWPTAYPNVNTTGGLFPYYSAFPPTPIGNLDGKLMQDQYFDNSNNLIKSVNYYYHQAAYTQNFYDVKAIDNVIGGIANENCPGSGIPQDFETNGNRSVIIFVSPAKSYYTLEDSVIETTYSGGNSIKHKKAYLYNDYYQQAYESEYNSDGSQTITYTKTSLALKPAHPLQPLGYALAVNNMQAGHIYDLPMEQTTIHRGLAGDSTVISSRLNIYQGPLPLIQSVYIMETTTPLALNSQFVPYYYDYPGYPGNPTGSTDSLKMDSHYVLYNTADYSINNLLWTLHSLQGNTAYIWDETYNNILAQCTNTDSSNIAFSSFETSATGRWSYNGSGITADNTAPTGSYAYSLPSGSISRGTLSAAITYVVSYWSKSGSNYSVTGSTSVKQGKTINGWTYFEHTVTGTSTVSITGGGSIDEVRLYPSTSQMISYTYNQLIGISTGCDAGNKITYYFYDNLSRLKWIKDQDGNIIKTFKYHFVGNPN